VVGRRVVVRRVVPGERGPSGGPALTDVLGICESWEDDVVTVRTEHGDLVSIPTGDIVAGKTVPPRATSPRAIDAEEADRRAHPGWPPVEQASLGDWLMRASGGFSNRGNSVLALGDPGLPLDQALLQVVQWYDARGLPPRAHALPGSPVAGALEEAGWDRYEPTVLMLTPLTRALRHTPPSGVPVRQDVGLDEAWLATDERAARHGEAARQVLEGSLEGGEVTFATVRGDDGVVTARGRGVVHDDWLGVSSLWTSPDHRGQGLGTAVLRSLLDWGGERGATTAYLQVVEANTAALRLYEARGFERHHDYAYYVAPG
jgi:GNAT superfamily N-acetyltransferase